MKKIREEYEVTEALITEDTVCFCGHKFLHHSIEKIPIKLNNGEEREILAIVCNMECKHEKSLAHECFQQILPETCKFESSALKSLYEEFSKMTKEEAWAWFEEFTCAPPDEEIKTKEELWNYIRDSWVE